MKKGVILMLLAFISVGAFAQISWNAKVGLNLSNYLKDDDAKVKAGFNIGAGMEYSFTEIWSIQPSLLFTTKGARTKMGDYKVTSNPMYLEIPVMGAARFNVAPNTNIVISAGPYFACGVGGKNSMKIEGGTIKYDVFGDSNIQIGDESIQAKGLKRFDAGLGIGVACELSSLVIGLNTEFGFVKLSDYANWKGHEQSPRNMNVSISLGYKF